MFRAAAFLSNSVAPKGTSGLHLEFLGLRSALVSDGLGSRQAVSADKPWRERGSEEVSWGSVTKSAIKLAALVVNTRTKPAQIVGQIDNQ